MTRLLESDVSPITENLKRCDRLLKKQTGESLLELAFAASGKEADVSRHTVAAVPVTTGIGLIGGFCDTVAAIARYLGASAFAIRATDVAGIEDAFAKEADILFLADDLTFTALNVKKGLCSDNGDATGRGFATALKAAGGCGAEGVLVLGAGPVGTAAAASFVEDGIPVQVYDRDAAQTDKLREKIPQARVAENWQECSWQAIFDATTSGGFIHSANVNAETWIAAPGMPLGVTAKAAAKCAGVIHNPLELGVAVMLCDVL